jgi:hypothetical protein
MSSKLHLTKKSTYLHTLLGYFLLNRQFLLLPYDIKNIIFSFLEKDDIYSIRYCTRIYLLNMRPSLYLVDQSHFPTKLLMEEILSKFTGKRILEKQTGKQEYNTSFFKKEYKKTFNGFCGFHGLYDCNDYFFKDKSKKLTKYQYADRNLKKDNSKLLEKKKREKKFSQKQTNSRNFKSFKYLISIESEYNNEDEYLKLEEFKNILYDYSNFSYFNLYDIFDNEFKKFIKTHKINHDDIELEINLFYSFTIDFDFEFYDTISDYLWY